VVNAVLLKPLPYAHGDRLLRCNSKRRARNAGSTLLRGGDQRLQAQSHSLDGLVEYHNMNSYCWAGRTGTRGTGVVSWNYFDVFGLKPLFGRNFRPDDEHRELRGADAQLRILDPQLWRRPHVVSKTFTMNDKLHTVIGILPRCRNIPTRTMCTCDDGVSVRSRPAFIANRQSRMMRVFGRMKPELP